MTSIYQKMHLLTFYLYIDMLKRQAQRLYFNTTREDGTPSTATHANKDMHASKDMQAKAASALQEYGNAILRVAYSYLHTRVDAEDVLQDTLLQLMKSDSAFASPEHEKAWLLRVAINISKNKLRYNKRRETLDFEENTVSNKTEDFSFVWEAVKSLPMAYREVIHLYYQEEYDTVEIAKILQKNEATIRSLLHRARAKLKKQLQEVYDFEE